MAINNFSTGKFNPRNIIRSLGIELVGNEKKNSTKIHKQRRQKTFSQKHLKSIMCNHKTKIYFIILLDFWDDTNWLGCLAVDLIKKKTTNPNK